MLVSYLQLAIFFLHGEIYKSDTPAVWNGTVHSINSFPSSFAACVDQVSVKSDKHLVFHSEPDGRSADFSG